MNDSTPPRPQTGMIGDLASPSAPESQSTQDESPQLRIYSPTDETTGPQPRG